MTSRQSQSEKLLEALEATRWRVEDHHHERFVRSDRPEEVYINHADLSVRLSITPEAGDTEIASLTLFNPLDPSLPAPSNTDGFDGELALAHQRIANEITDSPYLEGVTDHVIIALARVPTSATDAELNSLAADLTAVSAETSALHEAILETVSTWSFVAKSE